ncbi:Hypp52 [Branchiostoma lanceolatum]|uniref:Hypp52 protein n=1 Tax=Branchiostoma lanceolatum TaxID=7740 RepID=A0A8J9VWT6_BRALA|nr:Hypp52 [Branchiostoma lanceolatum]
MCPTFGTMPCFRKSYDLHESSSNICLTAGRTSVYVHKVTLATWGGITTQESPAADSFWDATEVVLKDVRGKDLKSFVTLLEEGLVPSRLGKLFRLAAIASELGTADALDKLYQAIMLKMKPSNCVRITQAAHWLDLKPIEKAGEEFVIRNRHVVLTASVAKKLVDSGHTVHCPRCQRRASTDRPTPCQLKFMKRRMLRHWRKNPSSPVANQKRVLGFRLRPWQRQGPALRRDYRQPATRLRPMEF